MANVLVDEVSLQNIGNSIRNKKGVSTLYKPAEMASAIDSIPTQRSKWWLPPDIPDIFDLWLPENGDTTYVTYCYWILDTKVPTDEVKKITLKNSMFSSSSTVNITIGHIISGVFVGDILENTQLAQNETYDLDYSNFYEQYIVVRVYSGIGGWNPVTALIADEYHTSIRTIPVIAISYFGEKQFQIDDGFVFNFLKYIKLKTPYSVNRLGTPKNVYTLEYLDYKDCYSFADNARWLYTAYSGYRSLKIFEFPSLPMYTSTGGQSSTINSSTFMNCENLFELDLHNLAIPPMSQWPNAFNGCSSLKKINISTWDMTDFTISDNMFTGCSALDTIICEHTIFPSTSFKLNFSNRLTVDTLLNVINALPTISEGIATPTLTLGTTNITKLTAEQIQIATNKGWIVA